MSPACSPHVAWPPRLVPLNRPTIATSTNPSCFYELHFCYQPVILGHGAIIYLDLKVFISTHYTKVQSGVAPCYNFACKYKVR